MILTSGIVVFVDVSTFHVNNLFVDKGKFRGGCNSIHRWKLVESHTIICDECIMNHKSWLNDFLRSPMFPFSIREPVEYGVWRK